MKFIHTSDWHLGKKLDGHSRIKEEEQFCDDFIKIIDENNIDLVIIAGNIYDKSNPPAQAEKLFYETILKISDNGKRCVLIIGGDKDKQAKLSVMKSLFYEQGVIVLEHPSSIIKKCKFNGFEVLEAIDGGIKLDIKGEKTTLITLPYLSEDLLNKIIKDNEYLDMTYSEKVGTIFKRLENNFSKDSINICVSHIVVGEGKWNVDKKYLPSKAQYIALGHLHKPQKVSERLNAYYSGSPLQYGKYESGEIKGAYIVDIHKGENPKIEKISFKNYKPIEIFKCVNIDEAIKICEENKNRELWSYFEINVDNGIAKEDIKKMNLLLNDIVEIKTISNLDYNEKHIDVEERPMKELFKEFYEFSIGVEPKGELMDLFLDIISEEGEA